MTDSKEALEGEDEKVSEGVAKLYRDRLKILKKAQEYSQADEIPKSVELYGQYLNALAMFYKVDEQKLEPKLFDQEKDLAELFLLSHVYWDLAKAYDRSPNLHLESIRCLEQFVKFTAGYKYQYVNARTIKAFIRKRLAHNPKAFKQAYERIQVESKGCFISTDLYGSSHQVTCDLRTFKVTLTKSVIGKLLIEIYYQNICPLYFKLNKTKIFRTILRPIIKTSLLYFSKLFTSDPQCR
jgi:hypothetical protein